VTADVARMAEKAEKDLMREAALEKAQKAAESHRLQMRDSFDDFKSPEPARSMSRLSWRDDYDAIANDRGSIDTYSYPGPVAPSSYGSYNSYDSYDSYDSPSSFGSYDSSSSYKSKA